MAKWLHKIRLKHLMTDNESHAEVQASMILIADVIDRSTAFAGFSTTKFRNIPSGDHTFGPVDYANKYLDELYNFADDHHIWIA
jgi:hypothetical protein